MGFPLNKTKIVCTIGPASESSQIMEKMILAGMNVARLNFSHGDFASHGRVIKALRAASQSVGRRVAIMAVIFTGAIGGFLSSGIIGSIVGATIPTLGYRLFKAWLDMGRQHFQEQSHSKQVMISITLNHTGAILV
jgi:hypothetical protein